MNKMNFSDLMNFLSGSETLHRELSAALAADSRGDEADFEKIRANVFGIFKAVLETSLKKYGESDEAMSFFRGKLRDIPASWRAALAAAGDKGDSAAAYVEKLKLQSVSEIEKALAEGKDEMR